MKDLNGILVALATPLSNDGSEIDYGRLCAHIDDMIEAGIHGIVPASGTGEYAFMTDAERMKVIEVAVRHINGRVPVVAQTSSISTADVIDRSKHAEQLGVDGLMILPPYLEIPSKSAIVRHYEMIARSVATPLVLYNVPFHAAEVDENMYRELIAVENIDYIKDSAGNMASLQKLIGTGGKVLTGSDALAPWAIMAGVHGMIWGAPNFAPHECVKLYELIRVGKIDDALSLWEKMRGIMLWLDGNGHDVNYIAGVKAAARITGRDLGPARRPTPPVSGAARHDIRLALSQMPNNRACEEYHVWRNWSEERNWLIQNHKAQISNLRYGN